MSAEPEAHARAVSVSQGVVLTREVVRLLLAMALTSLLGSRLPESAWGFIAGYVAAIYALAQFGLDLGIGGLVAREAARNPASERPLLEFVVASRAVGGVVAGGVVLVLAFQEPAGGMRNALLAVAASMPLLAPAVLGVVFQVRQDQTTPALVSIGTGVAMYVAALAAFAADMPPLGFAGLWIGREVVGGVVLWVLARHRLGGPFRPGWRDRGAAVIGAGAAAQAVAVACTVLSTQCGTFMLRALARDRGQAYLDVGVWAYGVRLVNPLIALAGALVAPLLPVLALRAATDAAAFARVVRAAAALGVSVALAAVVVVNGAGADLLVLVYHGRAPTEALVAFRWLSGELAAVCVGAVLTTALLAARGEVRLMRVGVLALAVQLALGVLCIPRWGPGGAAVAACVGESSAAALAFLALVRHHGLRSGTPR